MFTRILFSFCFIISMYTVSFSQGGHYGGHNENVKELCKILQTSNFSTNTAADDALDRILAVTGMSKNFTLYPCSDIENCAAVTINGDRFILYDKDFMEDISNSTSSWSNLSILAHEIGHHVNGHTRDYQVYKSGARNLPTLAKKREEELEADEYSGFVMQKLGAKLEQAQAAVNLYGSDGDDTYSTHPNKAKRLAAIKKGYDKAKSDEKTKVIYVEKETNKVIKEEISNTSNITSGKLYDSRDGKEYKTVKIGNQTWMAENLAYKPNDIDFASIIESVPSHWADWGYLYNWQTAKNICPAGWHLPSITEWKTLTDYLGGVKVAGAKMKSKGWWAFKKGTNESGFNAAPGGWRHYDGDVKYANFSGNWWCYPLDNKNYHFLVLDKEGVHLRYISRENYGFSVRCIKD